MNSLSRARLVTLVGVPGTARTRLALQLAADALEATAPSFAYVDVRRLTSGHELLRAVGAALNTPDRPLSRAALVASLVGTACLLLLDACEALHADCAALARELVRRCQGITVLATSREPLGVPGESVRDVARLGAIQPRLSSPDSRSLTPREREVALYVARGALTREIAAALFISRGTVRTHIERIFRKTGVHSRAQLAAWVMQRLPKLPSAI